MTDHLITLPLDRTHLEWLTDPRTLHREVMRFLPDLGGATKKIRADTQTLFRVDLPSGPLGVRGRLALRMRSDAVSAHEGSSEPTPSLYDGARITALVAAERRTTWQGRVTTRAVADGEADDWARELLRRHGLDAVEVAVSPSRRFGTPPLKPKDGGKKESKAFFAVRDVSATVRVVDEAAAASAMADGIGRGRSYGLGMVAVLSAETMQGVAA